MLCKINCTLGGATDERARAINFLRAVQAICTAPAGSTPSVASVSTPTASPVIGTGGSVNVITEVISNTEAGGWSVSSSTNITSNYSNTFASPYQLDMYRDSGKATYPYRKLSFRTNPRYAFSSSYTTYPIIVASHGFNTAPDASGNYQLGTTFDLPVSGGVTNRYRFDVNWHDADANAMNYCYTLRPNSGEYLIASTERYFIAISGGLGGTAGTLTYIGLRTTNSWEDQYDDNPPLASLTYDGGGLHANSSGTYASAWMRTFQTTGQQNSQPAWYRVGNSGYQYGNPTTTGDTMDPLSGYASTGGSWNDYRNALMWWGNQLQVPMLPGYIGMMRSKLRAETVMVGPVVDPATGTLVPPAFPITVARNVQNSQNPGGTLIGLYKSLGGTDTFMQLYYTPGQTFIVNNEAYYAYALGNDTNNRDLFLVRKY
jgi:hypothetical protein